MPRGSNGGACQGFICRKAKAHNPLLCGAESNPGRRTPDVQRKKKRMEKLDAHRLISELDRHCAEGRSDLRFLDGQRATGTATKGRTQIVHIVLGIGITTGNKAGSVRSGSSGQGPVILARHGRQDQQVNSEQYVSRNSHEATKVLPLPRLRKWLFVIHL